MRLVRWHGRLVVLPHRYQRDPYSGAGNCWCGHPEPARPHPHRYLGSLRDPERCVCGAGFLDPLHVRAKSRADCTVCGSSHCEQPGGQCSGIRG